jgi:hypothetical protein
MRTIPQETKGIQKSNDQNNGIIERFNKIVNKPEPIEIKEDIIQEETPLYKNKYVIIGGILFLSGLT